MIGASSSGESRQYDLIVKHKGHKISINVTLYHSNDVFFIKMACLDCKTCLGDHYYYHDFDLEAEMLSRMHYIPNKYLGTIRNKLRSMNTTIEEHILTEIYSCAEYGYKVRMEELDKQKDAKDRTELARKICSKI